MKFFTFVLVLLIGAATIVSVPVSDPPQHLDVRSGEYTEETQIVIVNVYVETETEILYVAKCGGWRECDYQVFLR